MFLQLAHTKLDVYKCSKELALSCYLLTRKFPEAEKFGMVQQIRRAAMSIHLNIAEGCSRKSKTERRRYLEISRGSVFEIDTDLDIALELKYTTTEEMDQTGKLIVRTFSMLSAMLKT